MRVLAVIVRTASLRGTDGDSEGVDSLDGSSAGMVSAGSSSDGSGSAGESASIDIDVKKANAAPAEYTYSAA